MTVAGGATLGVLAVVAGVVALAVVAIIVAPVSRGLMTRNATVFAIGDEVGMTGSLGRRVVIPRSRLGRISLRAVAVSGQPALAYTFFVDVSGRCAFKIGSRRWSIAELRELARLCGLPIEGSWDAPPATPGAIDRAIPGAFPVLRRFSR